MAKGVRRDPRLREPIREPLTDEIKILLIRKKLTITTLADELGMNRQYLSATINGHQRYVDGQRKIAAHLGVDLDSIFPVVNPEKSRAA
jgi:transcriptional regulator with XRE-family HTH domain